MGAISTLSFDLVALPMLPSSEKTMTADERQVLYDKLMEGTPAELVISHNVSSNHVLDALEPIIDRMLEAAREPAAGDVNAIDVHGLGVNVLPDGESVIIDGTVCGMPRGYRFTLSMERARLRSLAMFLITESYRA